MVRESPSLQHNISALTDREYVYTVGRAACGLFAVLSVMRDKSKRQRIGIPSFLCQSPLAAVLAAGWEPEFLDVDPDSANVSNAEWNRVINTRVDAVLYVHMFGNVGDIAFIEKICREKGIFVIEDAAQACGGSFAGVPCGGFGDVSMFSFGYTKPIDVGHGGALLTNDHALYTDIKRFTELHITNDPHRNISAQEFRLKFYAAKESFVKHGGASTHWFNGLLSDYAPLIPVKWNGMYSDGIDQALARLSDVVAQRREKLSMYVNGLYNTKLIPIGFSEGSVPWRATFRLPGLNWHGQNEISEQLRSRGIHVSNWYIPTHWMMHTENVSSTQFSGTETLSREIFQFWLDDRTEVDTVMHNITTISEILIGNGYGI